MKEKMVDVFMNNETVNRAKLFIKMVGMKTMLGCTLIGPAGMGKTHTIESTLEANNVPYIKFGGHITTAGTYEFLFENSDKLILFDDVSQVVNNVEIMELLKQALDPSGRSRVLHYRSKGVLNAGITPFFEFTGQCIFSFNLMDKKNPNVRAIIDRAPVIELKFSRKEIYDMMKKIANSESGDGLLNWEKKLVTDEIEQYTKGKSELAVSLRSQQLAFKIYKGCRDMYGEANAVWREQVQALFGKVKESWIREMLRDEVGESSMPMKDFAKKIAVSKDMSLRSAYRKIKEFVELEELYQNKIKFADVSVNPFK